MSIAQSNRARNIGDDWGAAATRGAYTLLLALGVLSSGCVPLLTPHAELRGTVGVAAGRTRRDVPQAARLTGTIDTVYLPTGLLDCDRDFDLGLGARFHFVEAEPEHAGASPARIGGLVSGAWYFHHGPFHRASLRLDLDALELDGRPLAGASLSLGFEIFGLGHGEGAFFSWEAIGAGAWTGEAGVRVEAMIAAHEDFGGTRYVTFTAGLSFRWPAGAGIAVVNPIFLAIVAANASGSSSGSSSGPSAPVPTPNVPSGGHSSGTGSMRTCGSAPTGAVDAVEEPPERGEGWSETEYACVDATGGEDWFDAYSVAEAERACVATSGTAGCACRRADAE